MNLQSHTPSSSYAVDQFYTAEDFYRGISNESRILARLIENIVASDEDPVVFTTNVLDNPSAWKKVLDEFKEIRQNCSFDNWDNAGSAKVEPQTVVYAEELIERMPNYLPLPEITPEPDGNINFEWYAGKDFVFEISVDGDKNIYYAGRQRGQKTSGKFEAATEIPETLEVYLRQFTSR